MSPRFSIITPVFDPPLWALEECISSVLAQTKTDWEWCIADDCSPNPKIKARLTRLAKSDGRVKLTFRTTNEGIVAASNSALSLATGDFIALLDHDDSLTPTALEEMSRVIDAHQQVDYIYSDEDKVDENGRHFDRFTKPDFAPERLRGQNYLCHFSVIRHSLMKQVGGFREGFDGSQDYDLFLRVTEQARLIHHIPRVLYHWRTVLGSTATNVSAKPYVFESARRAVEDHCRRVGIAADVSLHPVGYVKVVRRLQTEPLVSIIIPTRGDRKVVWGVETCLAANAISSTLNRSTYKNVEVILVHDRVTQLDPDLQELVDDSQVRVVWYDKPFDFSDKCNLGVIESKGDVILLLNDDTEVLSPDWLETLIGHLEDEDVAMVGPMTVLEDGRIQSAGHCNNPTPHNLGSGDLIGSVGPFGDRIIAREVSGVTGACMAIRREDYMSLGGMSLAFPHSFNDVDLAYKVLETGKRIIWTPYARLWHFESLSRDPRVREDEFNKIHRRWGRYFGQDHYTSE